MGIDQKPHIRDYWSKDPLHAQRIFPDTMTRDRFDDLTKCLHFEDNDGEREEGDRIWKLRHVINLLNDQCQSVYVPEKTITVDESLWKFRGRLRFVQYNPSKRARYGVKVYKLSASTGRGAGYTSAFKLYTGQDKTTKTTQISKQVVCDLMEMSQLFDKGYTMHTDNWYSSPDLFHYLQSRKTNAVGTVNMWRKFMPVQSDMNLGKPKGSMARMSTPTGMLCLQWVDRKTVTMLSTCHTSKMVTVSNRHGQEVVKPQVVVDYNTGMKGVDLSDQLAKSYPSSRKSLKWYKKIFFFLLDMAVVNAHAVYKILGNSITQLDFRKQLIRDLLAPARPAPSPSPTEQLGQSPLLFDHFPTELTGRKYNYRRCVLCAKEKIRKMTKSHCRRCNVALCTYGCYERWHRERYNPDM